MTDEEVIKEYNDMLEYFGELPNFEHHPRQFAHCVKVYRYYKERRSEQKTTGEAGVESQN